MRLQWIVLAALLVMPDLRLLSSQKGNVSLEPQPAPRIRPERKPGEKPSGKGFFVQLDWNASRGTSLARQTTSVILHEGETFDFRGPVWINQTDKAEEAFKSRLEVGIRRMNSGKIQLNVASRIKRTVTAGGLTRQMESNREQSVDGVVLDESVKVHLGLDENTGYREAFEVSIQEVDESGKK